MPQWESPFLNKWRSTSVLSAQTWCFSPHGWLSYHKNYIDEFSTWIALLDLSNMIWIFLTMIEQYDNPLISCLRLWYLYLRSICVLGRAKISKNAKHDFPDDTVSRATSSKKRAMHQQQGSDRHCASVWSSEVRWEASENVSILQLRSKLKP